MAVSRVGTYEALVTDENYGDGGEDVDPDDWSGTLSVGAGDNRMLVFMILCEQSSRLEVDSFTIGGQAYSYTGYVWHNASPDLNVLVFIWNEAAISSMSGTAIVYHDGSTNKKNAWSFATYKDVKQEAPTITTNEVDGDGTTYDLVTTSNSDDYIIVGAIDVSANRYPLYITDGDQASGTELDLCIESHGEQMAIEISDSSGGFTPTTVTNDGLNSHMAGLAIVLKATTGTILPLIHHHRKQIGAV